MVEPLEINNVFAQLGRDSKPSKTLLGTQQPGSALMFTKVGRAIRPVG